MFSIQVPSPLRGNGPYPILTYLIRQVISVPFSSEPASIMLNIFFAIPRSREVGGGRILGLWWFLGLDMVETGL